MLGFVTEARPRYISQFDVAVNVLAYVPFGFLAALAVLPTCRPVLAALIGAVAGLVLSFAMEFAQAYLPGRRRRAAGHRSEGDEGVNHGL